MYVISHFFIVPVAQPIVEIGLFAAWVLLIVCGGLYGGLYGWFTQKYCRAKNDVWHYTENVITGMTWVSVTSIPTFNGIFHLVFGQDSIRDVNINNISDLIWSYEGWTAVTGLLAALGMISVYRYRALSQQRTVTGFSTDGAFITMGLIAHLSLALFGIYSLTPPSISWDEIMFAIYQIIGWGVYFTCSFLIQDMLFAWQSYNAYALDKETLYNDRRNPEVLQVVIDVQNGEKPCVEIVSPIELPSTPDPQSSPEIDRENYENFDEQRSE